MPYTLKCAFCGKDWTPTFERGRYDVYCQRQACYKARLAYAKEKFDNDPEVQKEREFFAMLEKQFPGF